MTKPGLIQVYTGNGKGKTTASLGLALRAVGHGMNVFIIQFMKDNTYYGESTASEHVPRLTIVKAGRHTFVDLNNPDPVDVKMAQDGWQQAKEAITSRNYQVVIMDELNVAMASKLIDTAEVAAFLQENRNNGVEMILTGRYAPQEIKDLADYVTEMTEIKHPFQQGILSRKGIDY